MKLLISVLTIVLSVSVLAQQVPNTFEAGNPIVASEVNANFDALEAEIASLKAQVETLQTDSGDGMKQFVGNSTGTVDGTQGIRTMTELCQADFPGSRMCTTEEYAKTIDFPLANYGATYAWVNPGKIIDIGANTSVDAFTGRTLSDPNYLNCTGWTRSLSRGFTVNSSTGRFSANLCSDTLPLACCK